MQTTIQKWLAILGGLGALYLVVINPNGFYKATQGLKNLTAGSVVSIETGGAK